jgi:small subunit ribosomal protein S3
MGTRITLIAEKPGMIIGRRGGAIKTLTEAVEKDFKFDSPAIEVQEESNPNLNAQIMAQKLAVALERGWHFRRAGHSTVKRIMDAGAKGCQVEIAGKLTGERHRTEKFKEGHVKYCGEPALKFMSKGYAVAKKKPGVLGVTVWIMPPNAKLPDEIEIGIKKAMEAEKKAEVKQPTEQPSGQTTEKKPAEPAQTQTQETEKK